MNAIRLNQALAHGRPSMPAKQTLFPVPPSAGAILHDNGSPGRGIHAYRVNPYGE